MDGLSAKVFRTYNASFVLQQQLELKQFNIDDPIDDKVSYYNNANKRVAKLCNHQRTVPKNFDDKSQQMENELNDYKQYLNELDDYVKNFKKNKNKYHDSVVGKLKKIFPLDKNKAEKTLIKLKDKVKTMDKKLNERKGNKEIALGTSKLNYMDPRITVSWCKKYEVPIERVFTKSIRDKFPWAMYTGPDYKF
jgi:DNA topoisomerase-1